MWFHSWRDCFKPYKDFLSLHTIFSLPLTIKPFSYYIYISFEKSPFKKTFLTSIWCTLKSSILASTTSTTWIESIHARKKMVSLKSIPLTSENPLTKFYCFLKTKTQNPWLFPMLWIFTIQSLHKPKGVHWHQYKIHMKDSHTSQSLLNFLALVKEFFHPSSLVFDLKPYVLIQNSTMKPLFPY